MKTEQMLQTMNRKAVLSTLWIFILLNMLFRDMHEFARAGFIEEIMSMVVAQETLLIAGIVLEIPIGMVILSRLLPYRWNRLANIVASIFVIVIALSFGTNDLDDIWFLGVEVIALLGIIWYAWTWTLQKEADLAFA